MLWEGGTAIQDKCFCYNAAWPCSSCTSCTAPPAAHAQGHCWRCIRNASACKVWCHGSCGEAAIRSWSLLQIFVAPGACCSACRGLMVTGRRSVTHGAGRRGERVHAISDGPGAAVQAGIAAGGWLLPRSIHMPKRCCSSCHRRLFWLIWRRFVLAQHITHWSRDVALLLLCGASAGLTLAAARRRKSVLIY